MSLFSLTCWPVGYLAAILATCCSKQSLWQSQCFAYAWVLEQAGSSLNCTENRQKKGDNRRKMITQGIAGVWIEEWLQWPARSLENICNKAGAGQQRSWPFNLVEVLWAGCSQLKAWLVFLKFRIGFCLLLLLDALDSVAEAELLKSLEELR